MTTSADTSDAVVTERVAKIPLMPLLRGAERLLTHSLYERLQSNDGLVRGDFVASFEHVQEREFTSGLEGAVLHAVNSVRHQRLRIELG